MYTFSNITYICIEFNIQNKHYLCLIISSLNCREPVVVVTTISPITGVSVTGVSVTGVSVTGVSVTGVTGITGVTGVTDITTTGGAATGFTTTGGAITTTASLIVPTEG